MSSVPAVKSRSMTIYKLVWFIITLFFTDNTPFIEENFSILGGLGFAFTGLNNVRLDNFSPSVRTTRGITELRLSEYFVKPVHIPPPRKVLWDQNMQFVNPVFGGRGVGSYLISPKLKRNHMKHTSFKFDQTMGYPGEGWKKFSIATWNTRSLTNERYDYCKNLNYDVFPVTEQ